MQLAEPNNLETAVIGDERESESREKQYRKKLYIIAVGGIDVTTLIFEASDPEVNKAGNY